MLREIPGALAAELRALEWRGRRGLEAGGGGGIGNPGGAGRTGVAFGRALVVGDHRLYGHSRRADGGGFARHHAGRQQHRRGACGLAALRLFVYQSLPFLLCLFLSSVVGLVGFATSRYGYAWLVGAITACLVMLMSFDQPQSAFDTAVNRVVDVMIGTAASLVVCALSPIPSGGGAAATSPSLGSGRRLGTSGDAATALRCSAGCLETFGALLLHACRGGLAGRAVAGNSAEWIAPVSSE